jgi:hypothetical protein
VVAGGARAAAGLDPGTAYRLARIASAVALVNNISLIESPVAIELLMANLDPDMRPFAAEAIGMGFFSRWSILDGAEDYLIAVRL